MSQNLVYYSLLFCCLFSLLNADATESLNLLVRLKSSNTNRYCLQMVLLPKIITVKQFGWYNFYYAPIINGCDKTNISSISLLPITNNTMLVVKHNANCSFAEQSYNFQLIFGDEISLLYISAIPYTTISSLTTNKTIPVTIPVLLIRQSEFHELIKNNITNKIEQVSIDFPLPQLRFNVVVILMYILIILVLFAGTMWAGDEFIQKIGKHAIHYTFKQEKYSSVSTKQTTNNDFIESLETNQQSSSNLASQVITDQTVSTSPTNTASSPSSTTIISITSPSEKVKKPSSEDDDQAILTMPYCTIGVLLVMATVWILLIWKFPKVMVKVLQMLFCISGIVSLMSCLKRFSYIRRFRFILRRFKIQSCQIKKPCKFQIDSINYFSIFSLLLSLILVILWYIYRKQEWSWVLQDIIGVALCIVVLSIYRLANMKVITLILLLFFFYDIFFVFITPYIPFFSDSPKTTTTTLLSTQTTISTTHTNLTTTLTTTLSPYYVPTAQPDKKHNPSIMEQVALGLGSGEEVVPILFSVPKIAKNLDPCIKSFDQKVGFGDIILPGILITYCKLFDIASKNRIHVYYIQSMIAYSVGYIFVIIALTFMNMAQPALLYLVPCSLLSTIVTGLIRHEFKELYSGQRIKQIFKEMENDDQVSICSKTENQTTNDENGLITSTTR